MRYLPLTEADTAEMLAAVGVGSIEDLLAGVPAENRLRRDLALPAPASELELKRELGALAAKNTQAALPSFLGYGIYPHEAPALVDQLLTRSEFYTAYTPYQPEIAQGTLQAMFEFQTLSALLLGTELANAGMYDAATATAEAVLMARRVVKGARRRVVLAASLHPETIAVIRTYLAGFDAEIVTAPFTDAGRLDRAALAALIGPDTAAVVVQTPDVFGLVDDYTDVCAAARGAGAFSVVVVPEPISLGLLKPPGEMGADVVVAEGQGLTGHVSFGGPGFGMFGTREAYVRQMPGRICGRAEDADGRPGFVLTLSTREQHIRREKATSNICTNQGLMSLAATMYLTWLGKAGMSELAAHVAQKAAYTRRTLAALDGFGRRYDGPVFSEFVITTPIDAETLVSRAAEEGVVAGVPLGRAFADRPRELLVNVNETHTRADVDHLARVLARVSR